MAERLSVVRKVQVPQISSPEAPLPTADSEDSKLRIANLCPGAAYSANPKGF